MLVSCGNFCSCVISFGIYLVSMFGLVFCKVNWYWVWVIWFSMVRFCIGCMYSLILGRWLSLGCRCWIILLVVMLCLLCGLRLISRWLVLRVGLLLLMLM